MSTRTFALIAVLSCATTAAGCPLDPTKVPQCTGNEQYPDPCSSGQATPAFGSPESAPALCLSACVGLRRASCAEGYPSGNGTTCLATCERSSKVRAWPLKCWAAAETRADVVACGPQLRCLAIRP